MVPTFKVPCQFQLPPPLATNKFEVFMRSKSHKYTGGTLGIEGVPMFLVNMGEGVPIFVEI